MLQHNIAQRGKQAHLAHAAMVSLHAICCGAPALAMIAAAASGAASVGLLADSLGYFHEIMHAHEIWILVVSALLVSGGGWMELQARRSHNHGFPWLFALSVVCFLANLTIVAIHRL